MVDLEKLEARAKEAEAERRVSSPRRKHLDFVTALMDAAPELIAELRELRRDKKRLDWLESVGDIVNIDVDRDLSDSAQIVSNAFTGVTVRAAIDAAMKQSPVEEKENPNAD